MSNEEIIRFYQKTETNMLCRFNDASSLDPLTNAETLAVIGHLRFKSAANILLRYIEYNPIFDTDLHDSSFQDNTVRTTNGRMIFGAGASSPLRNRYPVFAALLRIGTEMGEIGKAMSICKSNDAMYMYSCLGMLAGDGYFVSVINGNSMEMPGGLRVLVQQTILTSKREKAIAKDLRQMPSVSLEFDTMQDELVSRFKSQLASGDAEIADTIYTMGFIRSDRAMPLLIDNQTICPQVSTNVPLGFVFPAAEALVSIAPPLGICFEKLDAAAPMSLEESLWLRVAHEVYPEGLEYELFCAAATNNMRAVRLMKALPWRRLTEAEMSDSWSVGASADRP